MFKSFLLLFLLVFCFLMRKFIKIAKNKINNSYLRYMQTLPQVPHFPHDQITIPFSWFCIHTFLIPHSSFHIPIMHSAGSFAISIAIVTTRLHAESLLVAAWLLLLESSQGNCCVVVQLSWQSPANLTNWKENKKEIQDIIICCLLEEMVHWRKCSISFFLTEYSFFAEIFPKL